MAADPQARRRGRGRRGARGGRGPGRPRRRGPSTVARRGSRAFMDRVQRRCDAGPVGARWLRLGAGPGEDGRPTARPGRRGPGARPRGVARAIVLKQLSMAPRSRHQLADKLRQRGCPDDVSARVLDRMEAVGLVDDDAYAQMVVRSKQATRGLAKRALAQELRVKGVADDDDRGRARAPSTPSRSGRWPRRWPARRCAGWPGSTRRSRRAGWPACWAARATRRRSSTPSCVTPSTTRPSTSATERRPECRSGRGARRGAQRPLEQRCDVDEPCQRG